DYIHDNQLDVEEADYNEIPTTSFVQNDAPIKEFKIAKEVRHEMEKHSLKEGESDFESDSDLNRSIQAKFDDVFERAKGTTEAEAGSWDEDTAPEIPLQDEVEDIPHLEVNLGDGAEDKTAGFKAGLSPEDGTGEFEINAAQLASQQDDE